MFRQCRTLKARGDVIVEIQEEVEWAPIPALHISGQHWCQPEWPKHWCVNMKLTAYESKVQNYSNNNLQGMHYDVMSVDKHIQHF
jgi:hypothetical protein